MSAFHYHPWRIKDETPLIGLERRKPGVVRLYFFPPGPDPAFLNAVFVNDRRQLHRMHDGVRHGAAQKKRRMKKRSCFRLGTGDGMPDLQPVQRPTHENDRQKQEKLRRENTGSKKARAGMDVHVSFSYASSFLLSNEDYSLLFRPSFGTTETGSVMESVLP